MDCRFCPVGPLNISGVNEYFPSHITNVSLLQNCVRMGLIPVPTSLSSNSWSFSASTLCFTLRCHSHFGECETSGDASVLLFLQLLNLAATNRSEFCLGS